MVQVLPRQPTFLEIIGPQLGQGAQALGQGVRKSADDQKNQAMVAKLNDPNTSAMDFASILAKMPKEYREAYAPIQKERVKSESEASDKKTKAKSTIDIANEMEGLLKYTGATWIPGTSSFLGGSLNREAVEKREYFDEEAAAAASYFRELETKGQLPLGLYEKVIEPRLPNSKLSERVNKGRIEGLISLAKKYGGIEGEKSGSKSLQKPPKGTKITDAIVDQLLEQTGNDPKKAQELAKGLGYEF